jgi:hypothetical protein
MKLDLEKILKELKHSRMESRPNNKVIPKKRYSAFFETEPDAAHRSKRIQDLMILTRSGVPLKRTFHLEFDGIEIHFQKGCGRKCNSGNISLPPN